MQLPIYFISDIHLMLKSSQDEHVKTQKLFQFFEFLSKSGGTLIICVELFDFYYE